MKDDVPRAHIVQINVSAGCVPKRPVPSARVMPLGLEGDTQQDKVHHGGLERAICIYALEHILALQAEGNPIYPGSTGENLTVAGLDWDRMIPGARLQVGEAVELEITGYAAPCRTIVSSFHKNRFGRISQKAHPGWSRVYARVNQTGPIAPGDAVVLL